MVGQTGAQQRRVSGPASPQEEARWHTLKGHAGTSHCDMFHSRLAAEAAAGTDLLQEEAPIAAAHLASTVVWNTPRSSLTDGAELTSAQSWF